MGNYNSSNSLCPQGMLDLIETTNFDETEIRKWYKEFRKDFPEGYLTIAQFRELYSKHFPDGDATKFAEHVFRTFDADGDHQLDFREFMTGLSVTARGGPKDRLRWAFEMYDIDESGYITKDECVEIVKAILDLGVAGDAEERGDDLLPHDRVKDIFTRKDLDEDGCLTEDEFMDGFGEDHFLMRVLQRDQIRF